MTLEAIGQKLKAAREAQGLSLRQIYERTKIPINHLQSIDTGMPDDLPEPVYVAGFIKRYAECIGLDGQVLADEYRRADSVTKGTKTAVAAQQVYVTPEYLKHARIDSRPPTYKLWPFYAVVIVAVMVVLSWYSMQQSNTANQSDPSLMSLKDSAAQLQSQPGINSATPNASGTTPTSPTAAAAGDKVVLSATQHVWVEVKKQSSGESIFTGYLEQGDRREFQDSQGLRIRAGNGGSLSAEFKGKIEAFGPPGKVAERTFTLQNAVASSSSDPAATAAGTTTASASGTTAVTAVKPKKVRKSTDSSASHRYRSIDDGGSRSLPSDSYGDGGTRSIDVPYRYSEGRLDPN